MKRFRECPNPDCPGTHDGYKVFECSNGHQCCHWCSTFNALGRGRCPHCGERLTTIGIIDKSKTDADDSESDDTPRDDDDDNDESDSDGGDEDNSSDSNSDSDNYSSSSSGSSTGSSGRGRRHGCLTWFVVFVVLVLLFGSNSSYIGPCSSPGHIHWPIFGHQPQPQPQPPHEKPQPQEPQTQP